MRDGVRLVACNDGVEAQVWDHNFLKAARWWPNIPGNQEWSLFTRTCGIGVGTAVPDLTEPEWLEMPWHGAEASSTIFTRALTNKRLMATATTVLLAPCFYLAAEWMTFSALSLQVKQDTIAIEQDSQTIRADRSKALSALEAAEDLISLNPHPHQIEILSRAHNLLSPYSVTLASWDYDEGELEFGLESEQDMDARLFITAFENDPLFTAVSSGTRGNRLLLKMNVADFKGATP